MRIHLIVDFQYNYYRNKSSFDRRAQKFGAKRLSAVVNGEEVDTTYMYLTLKDIESYRKQYLMNKDGTVNDVVVSIAVDSKTDRKEMDTEYKSNRSGRLDSDDFASIDRTIDTLREVGYNIYKKETYEADDLIRGLVEKYENDFDLTIIHTNDSDILVNLSPKVALARFKSSLKKHVLITEDNFSSLMGDEFKCDMPLNCIMLYKSLVGDKSDKVKGVSGFGVKAFDKLIWNLREQYGNAYFLEMKYADYTEQVLNDLHTCGKLTDTQFEEAIHSFNLVKPKELDFTELTEPIQKDSYESRKLAYSKYEMVSLIG